VNPKRNFEYDIHSINGRGFDDNWWRVWWIQRFRRGLRMLFVDDQHLTPGYNDISTVYRRHRRHQNSDLPSFSSILKHAGDKKFFYSVTIFLMTLLFLKRSDYALDFWLHKALCLQVR
jgi:hypothetical protein